MIITQLCIELYLCFLLCIQCQDLNCLWNISYTCLLGFIPSTRKFITWQPQPKNHNIHVKEKTVFYWTWLPWKNCPLIGVRGSQPITIFFFLNFESYENKFWTNIQKLKNTQKHSSTQTNFFFQNRKKSKNRKKNRKIVKNRNIEKKNEISKEIA